MNKLRLVFVCLLFLLPCLTSAQTEDEFISKACCSGLSEEEALKVLDEALKKYPKSAKLYIERGNTKSRLLPAFAKEDNVGMVPDFDKAVSLAPNVYESYVARAEAYLNITKYAEALKDYNKALELVKKDGESTQIYDVLRGRANTKQFLKDWKGAIEDILECTQLMPTDLGYQYQLIAELYVQLASYQEAIKYYTFAIDSYEKDMDTSGEASAYYGRAFVYIENLQKVSEGCADLKKSVALNPRESGEEEINRYCPK